MASFQIPRLPSSREPKRGRVVGWVWLIRFSLVLAAPLGMTNDRDRSIGAGVRGYGRGGGIAGMAEVIGDIVEGHAHLLAGQKDYADRNGGQDDQEKGILDHSLTGRAGQACTPIHPSMTVRA